MPGGSVLSHRNGTHAPSGTSQATDANYPGPLLYLTSCARTGDDLRLLVAAKTVKSRITRLDGTAPSLAEVTAASDALKASLAVLTEAGSGYKGQKKPWTDISQSQIYANTMEKLESTSGPSGRPSVRFVDLDEHNYLIGPQEFSDLEAFKTVATLQNQMSKLLAKSVVRAT